MTPDSKPRYMREKRRQVYIQLKEEFFNKEIYKILFFQSVKFLEET
jgi:hypothetical protein